MGDLTTVLILIFGVDSTLEARDPMRAPGRSPAITQPYVSPGATALFVSRLLVRPGLPI